jgi:hypothetical protein
MLYGIASLDKQPSPLGRKLETLKIKISQIDNEILLFEGQTEAVPYAFVSLLICSLTYLLI